MTAVTTSTSRIPSPKPASFIAYGIATNIKSFAYSHYYHTTTTTSQASFNVLKLRSVPRCQKQAVSYVTTSVGLSHFIVAARKREDEIN